MLINLNDFVNFGDNVMVDFISLYLNGRTNIRRKNPTPKSMMKSKNYIFFSFYFFIIFLKILYKKLVKKNYEILTLIQNFKIYYFLFFKNDINFNLLKRETY